jgi:ATP-binding cassette subfamily E protein 1
MFDEPTSFLDIKQRLKAAKMIRSLLKPDIYVIAADHDLTIIDYLSDFVCVFYGEPGAYGVVTLPYSVKEGINIFLSGFIPSENIRFRNESVTISATDNQK